MKVTVSRSFSKKIQLKQFEPIDSFCAVQMEREFDEQGDPELMGRAMILMSETADQLCRDEVEKTLHKIRPSLIPKTGGKVDKEKARESSEESDPLHVMDDPSPWEPGLGETHP